MKHWALYLFLTLLSIPAFAQIPGNEDTLLSSARAASIENTGVSVHMMPFSLFNNPSRLRLGAQYKHKRFGYLLDLEYGTDKLRVVFGGDADPDYRFFGFRPEFRYDLNWMKRGGGYYLGLELPFTVKNNSHNGNLVDRDDNFFYVQDALERRLRISAILKIGRQLIAFRHLYLDGYFGAGVAYRHLSYSRLENTGPPEEQTSEWGCCELKKHGGLIRVEVALGLRLGYWIGRDDR